MLSQFFDLESFIHSIKTAIACVIGFLVTKLLNFPSDLWIVVTIMVVMCAQIYVGSVFLKAYLRFLGTLMGCLFASFIILTFGVSNLHVALTIGIAGFMFSYLAVIQENLSYTGTLGAVTTTIILLSANPTLLLALQRFLEISIGLLIATLVSQFVLPIHARTHLRRSQASALKQLRDYYVTMLVDYPQSTMAVNYYELDENIVKSLSKQRQLANESTREHFGSSFNPQHFLQGLYCEKEMLRAITLMHVALLKLKETAPLLINTEALRAFNDSVLETFNDIMMAVETETFTTAIAIPSLGPLAIALNKNIPTASLDNATYVHGFLFMADLLISSLRKLTVLYRLDVVGAASISTML